MITDDMTAAEIDAILEARREARRITFTEAQLAAAKADERAYERRAKVRLTMDNQDLVLGGYEI